MLLATAGLLFGAVPAAHAATIFSETFAGGVSGWANQFWVGDAGTARSAGSAAGNWSSLDRGVDTSTYQNVQLSYSYFIDGNVDQSLQVSARPNSGSAFTVVGSHASDTGGWQTANVNIAALADLASNFQIQFAVTPRPGGGVAPAGFEVRIDNVVISGDVDTTAPTATRVAPTPGTVITTSTAFTVTASDDISSDSQIQVRYRFESAADPGETFLSPGSGWGTLTAGSYTQNHAQASFIVNLGLATGNDFHWYAQVRDLVGNQDEYFMGTYTAGNTPPTFTSGPPPNGAVGVAYSHTFTASGTAPFNYSATPDDSLLPPGLSIAFATGIMSGTPTTAGTYTFDVEVAGSILPMDVETYTVVIAAAPEPPLITSAAPANGQETIAYSHTFTASGTGSVTFSHDSGTLPPGTSLVGDTLSGTPTSAGSYTFEIRATNGTVPDAVVEYTVVIANAPVPPTITTVALADATFGQPYSFPVTATGDLTFTYSSPDLAALGLSINSSTGVISGTPTAAGSPSVTITVSNGVNPDAVETFTLTINDQITMTSPAPSDGMEAVAYTHTFAATAGNAVSFSLQAGALPTGISLAAATISGTPSVQGTYNFTIRASNGVAPDVDTPYSVVIAAASVAPVITSGAPGAGVFNQPYTFTVTATGDPTLTFSSADLAALGLSINSSTGVIGGTPTVAGDHPVTITVSNGINPDAVENYTLSIDEDITVTSAAPVDGDVGIAYSHTFTGTASGPITFTQLSGTLPTGLTLTGAVLSGTPTADGSFTFTIRASTGINPDVDTVYTVEIDPAPPLITVTSAAPPAGVVGTAYGHVITIDSPVAPSFVVSSGSLPAGLALNATSGEIEGTPTADGTASFSITITDVDRLPTVVAFSITIDAASGGGDAGTPGLADTGSHFELGQLQSAAGLALLGIVLVGLSRWRVRTRRL